MQADNIGTCQHLVKRNSARRCSRCAFTVCDQHFHTKSRGNAPNLTANNTRADKPKGAAMQIRYRMAKKTELPAILPDAIMDIQMIAGQRSPQGKYQRNRMFRHCMSGIASGI